MIPNEIYRYLLHLLQKVPLKWKVKYIDGEIYVSLSDKYWYGDNFSLICNAYKELEETLDKYRFRNEVKIMFGSAEY